MTTKTPTRIYAVTLTAVGEEATPRLVRASNSAQALRHCARDTLTVKVASQDELVRGVQAGVQIEVPNLETAE